MAVKKGARSSATKLRALNLDSESDESFLKFHAAAPKSPASLKANYQDLLKFFALISMLTDHMGLFLFNDSWIMRVIGRYAMVIFCFFVGYNYHKTEENVSYCVQQPRYRSILLWGLFVHFVQICSSGHYLDFNILISIVVNLLIVDVIKNHKIPEDFAAFLCALLSVMCYRLVDYGTFPAVFILLGQAAQKTTTGNHYNAFVYCSLMGLLIFEYTIMNFSPAQMCIIFFIFLGVCYLLTHLDFKKRVRADIFLLSRYALPFYVIHITVLMGMEWLLRSGH